MVSSCLNAAGTIGRMMVNERIEAGRRERRVLARSPGPRGGWRAVRERTRALVSARAEGISIRILAAAAGVVTLAGAPARGRCRPGCAGRGAGELRAASWPAPEDPGPGKTPNSAA